MTNGRSSLFSGVRRVLLERSDTAYQAFRCHPKIGDPRVFQAYLADSFRRPACQISDAGVWCLGKAPTRCKVGGGM
jgi:hypothetical protein